MQNIFHHVIIGKCWCHVDVIYARSFTCLHIVIVIIIFCRIIWSLKAIECLFFLRLARCLILSRSVQTYLLVLYILYLQVFCLHAVDHSIICSTVSCMLVSFCSRTWMCIGSDSINFIKLILSALCKPFNHFLSYFLYAGELL